MRIESQKIDIHKDVKIADDAEIIASDAIHIGKYAVILPGFKVRCRSLWIGYHTYIGQGVEIGGGGCNGPNSHVKIGYRSLICERSFINCAESVTIGEHVAFGYETQVWTHGVWQPFVDGFGKQKQAPVTIGNEVWLSARCQVLAGVVIGDNVMVGMGSLINKNLPSGCLAVGRPAKAIKENVYPAPVSDEALKEELDHLVGLYIIVAEEKGFKPDIFVAPNGNIIFCYQEEEILFNTIEKTFLPDPKLSIYAEDFRDYLRRNGFGFYGGGFFESIVPMRFREGVMYNND